MDVIVELDFGELITKISILVRKELIELFGSFGLDVSGYVDSMYNVEFEGDKLILDILLPYSEILEYGSTGYEVFDKKEIVDWFISNVENNISEAEKFAEIYTMILSQSQGLFLGVKLSSLIKSELGD